MDRPGTFIVSVAYDITEDHLYVKDDYPRYLIPLRVIRGSDLPELVKIIKKNGPTQFKYIKNYFVMGSIFDDGEVDPVTLPSKGEKVVATFENKDNKLLCTHIKLIDRDDLLYVNLSVVDDLYDLAEKFIK